jgi:XTP/dITP diphosphohydrolase
MIWSFFNETSNAENPTSNIEVCRIGHAAALVRRSAFEVGCSMFSPLKKPSAINDLLRVMARLRGPGGCPWDHEQTHLTLRLHAIEEVYELIDAIEAGDDHEMAEELGDLLLQVVFHCQMAKERGAFDFEQVCRHLVDKLIRRHPHVFGQTRVKNVAEVWANWDQIKHAEKKGTHRERTSAFDGIPKHLPALLRAGKLVKKARKVLADGHLAAGHHTKRRLSKAALAKELFELAAFAQRRGWSAEELLGAEIKKRERVWRRREGRNPPTRSHRD